MKKTFSFLLLFLGITFALTAQNSEEKAVQSVIEQLFTGMQKHDSTMIRATFHPTARMQSIGINRKTNVMGLTTEENIDGFVKQISSLPANVQIEERVLSYEIRIDGNMATAWTPYELYVNGKRQHCGVDAFQLYKTENGWKIIALADTRRKCE
jgi:N-formylglutamate amidohydrolase